MKLPKSVPSPLGPVRVIRASKKKLGPNCSGDFDTHKRRIRILDSIDGVVALQVLFHEWTHMVICDVGLKPYMKNELAEEILCDAISNALCHWQLTGNIPGPR